MTDITQAAERQLLGVQVDCRNMIAALKLARWEATKWTVTVNLGLTAASAAFGDEKVLLALCAIFVFLLGLFLIWHYNERVTRVRGTARRVADYVRANIVDLENELGIVVMTEKTRDYDKEELTVFVSACVLSMLPPIAMLFVIAPKP